MSSKHPPFGGVVGWVHLPDLGPDGCTVRWRRRDVRAALLRGNAVGEHVGDVLATFPVPPMGWTDLAEIRQLGVLYIRKHLSWWVR